MIPFTMVVVDELRHRPSEMTLTERHHPVEALLLDGSDETLRMRIGIRCPHRRLYDANSRLAEPPPCVFAPFSTVWSRSSPLSAAVSVRLTWPMNSSSGCDVDPTMCTRRDARSMTNTV